MVVGPQLKLIRKYKRVLRIMYWSTPLGARDDLAQDSSIAAAILISKSWRWGSIFALQLIIALLMQWQSYEKIKESAKFELLLTSIIVFLFIAVTPIVGYLVRHARLCVRLARSSPSLSASQLENAALIFLSPTLIWLAGLLPLVYAINKALLV